MREQNHIARSLPEKPNKPKHIICHNCDAFGHLGPHYFQALKRIKRKKKLELHESRAEKAKPNLEENDILLKMDFYLFTSLSICISNFHFSNPHLTSHETLIPNNLSV